MPRGAMEEQDEERRRVAEHIEWQKQGAWVVLWGVHSRRFWAFACWPVIPEAGVVVDAGDPEALYSVMRYVEREHDFLRWRYGRSRGARSPGPRRYTSGPLPETPPDLPRTPSCGG
nr:hypothetical protein [Nocardiopsis alba]